MLPFVVAVLGFFGLVLMEQFDRSLDGWRLRQSVMLFGSPMKKYCYSTGPVVPFELVNCLLGSVPTTHISSDQQLLPLAKQLMYVGGEWWLAI